ncbi:MAG: transporter substrate-binding domain-containing protein, partial [Acidimicrobiia bacterium]|nr:transporter substrate-binding domain-containing protein [Acidimicrobiia bacterium]
MNKNFRYLLAVLVVLGLVATACTADETTDETTGPDQTTATTTGGDTTTETTAGGDVTGQTGGGATLDAVRARGTLKCGVSGSAVAFSETQSDGSVTGFDADMCRAIAAAVLGDATALEMPALTAAERFTVLAATEIDVLIRNTTWTQSRDTTLGLDFGPTTYYDGQGVMGKASQGFTADSTLADVEGAVLCTNAGTTTEKNITEGAAQA